MKAVIFFIITALCWIFAIVFGVRGFKTIVDNVNSNLVVMEAPGTATFTVKEAGKVSLWHNYQDIFEGKTIANDLALPGGFSFEIRPAGSTSVVIPLAPSVGNTTMNNGSTHKVGVGTFELPAAGDYTLTASAPAGETRVVSLSEGTFMENFGGVFGMIGGAVVLGLIGTLTLILAIVFLFLKPKSKPPTSPAHAA
ncbi:hypothetical protein [Roseibacillus persicicus]|uniref:hypothetical protein n=1 Tax=Roseibacillus persicicus TaxID=454148 RepID=UPI00280EF6C9|nr:hypothetical protein [Roseibacillus persicicus]MDQ8190780.1 hypothetical protein [Roseibacillus persicicus]